MDGFATVEAVVANTSLHRDCKGEVLTGAQAVAVWGDGDSDRVALTTAHDAIPEGKTLLTADVLLVAARINELVAQIDAEHATVTDPSTGHAIAALYIGRTNAGEATDSPATWDSDRLHRRWTSSHRHTRFSNGEIQHARHGQVIVAAVNPRSAVLRDHKTRSHQWTPLLEEALLAPASTVTGGTEFVDPITARREGVRVESGSGGAAQPKDTVGIVYVCWTLNSTKAVAAVMARRKADEAAVVARRKADEAHDASSVQLDLDARVAEAERDAAATVDMNMSFFGKLRPKQHDIANGSGASSAAAAAALREFGCNLGSFTVKDMLCHARPVSLKALATAAAVYKCLEDEPYQSRQRQKAKKARAKAEKDVLREIKAAWRRKDIKKF